jgi:hypothetical protein
VDVAADALAAWPVHLAGAEVLMPPRPRAVLTLLLLLSSAIPVLLARPALASTAVRLSLRQLAGESAQVVLGEVLETRPRWAGTRIVTDVVVDVHRMLKGPATTRVTLEVLGGEVGDVGQRVFGEAAFRTGETVLVFLHERRGLRRLDGRAGSRRLTVLGMAQGKLTVERGPDGRQRVKRDLSGLELVGGDAAAPAAEGWPAGAPGSAGGGIELEQFLRALQSHLGGGRP